MLLRRWPNPSAALAEPRCHIAGELRTPLQLLDLRGRHEAVRPFGACGIGNALEGLDSIAHVAHDFAARRGDERRAVRRNHRAMARVADNARSRARLRRSDCRHESGRGHSSQKSHGLLQYNPPRRGALTRIGTLARRCRIQVNPGLIATSLSS